MYTSSRRVPETRNAVKIRGGPATVCVTGQTNAVAKAMSVAIAAEEAARRCLNPVRCASQETVRDLQAVPIGGIATFEDRGVPA
jgi:hypothetical protein